MGGSPVLDVRLLGEPRVTVGGHPLEVDTRKAIAILAYLAVEGPTSRDHLIGLLWPEATSDRARATLRRTLSSLRSGIGKEHLDADRDRVALTGAIDVDAAVFDEEIGATHEHGHDPRDVCSACIPLLSRALDLYRGDFLEGFSIGDAPEFEDWARTVTEGYRLRAGEALNRLGMARAAGGDYPGAIGAVVRWIALDALHEPAHRQLMLLHAWSGDRPAAMAAYRDFVALLDRELGVPPLEETSELYEAILDEDLPPAPGMSRRPRAHVVKEAPKRSSLLGRSEELEKLRAAIAAIDEGGRSVAVTGDSWMGKTRLLEELAAIADSAGCTALLGRASRVEQGVPYAAVTQVITPALTAAQDAGLELPQWVRDELARLVPALAPGRTSNGADPLGDLRFLEAVHHLVRVLAASRPLVILFDDVQWLDTASTRLIGYLAARVAPLQILLVLSLRTDETATREVAELASRADLVIRLGPLRPGQLEGIVDGARARSIVDATGGVPLLVLEHLDAESSDHETPGVMRYVEERTLGLSDLARQVLAAGAVLGATGDTGLLRMTSGRTDDELVQAVEELISAGLLKELPGGEGVGFALDAAERFTYESTSLVRRRLLHKRAAQALAGLPRAAEDARVAATVAGHLQGAGDPEAAHWYRRAGDLARNAYANNEAKKLYETAMALGEENAGELHLALGELAIAGGDYQTAMAELRSAASRAGGEILSLIEHRIGEVHRLLGRFALAEEAFKRAERDHPDPTALYADWALLHHRLGSTDEALVTAEKALAAASMAGDHERSRAHNVLGLVDPDSGRALHHLDTALELARAGVPERTAALNNKARVLAAEGELATAIDLVTEAVGLAESTGHRHREAALRNHLADLHHRAGNAEEARHALTGAVTIFADIDTEAREPEVWLLSQW